MIEKVGSSLNSLAVKNADQELPCRPLASGVSSHLLFNTLNAVMVLCRKDPSAAAELTLELSTYLQKSLEVKGPLIPLEEELEHLLAYIHIQKTRFPGRLEFILAMDEGLSCQVPPFILQPLVDNAVVHGLLPRKEGGKAAVSLTRTLHSLIITIQDNGVGMTGETLSRLFREENHPHSLCRIQQALGAAGGRLDVRSAAGEGTLARMEIPAFF